MYKNIYKDWALTCKFPMRYINNSKPIMEIKVTKRFSHVLVLGWRFEPRELQKERR